MTDCSVFFRRQTWKTFRGFAASDDGITKPRLNKKPSRFRYERNDIAFSMSLQDGQDSRKKKKEIFTVDVKNFDGSKDYKHKKFNDHRTVQRRD